MAKKTILENIFTKKTAGFLKQIQEFYGNKKISLPYSQFIGAIKFENVVESLENLVSNHEKVYTMLTKFKELPKSVFDKIESQHLFRYSDNIIKIAENQDKVYNFLNKMAENGHCKSHSACNDGNLELKYIDDIIKIAERGDEVVCLMDNLKSRGLAYCTYHNTSFCFDDNLDGIYRNPDKVFKFIDNSDKIFPFIDDLFELGMKNLDEWNPVYMKVDELCYLAKNRKIVTEALRSFKKNKIRFDAQDIIENAEDFISIAKKDKNVIDLIRPFNRKNLRDEDVSISIQTCHYDDTISQIYKQSETTLDLVRKRKRLHKIRDSLEEIGINLFLEEVYDQPKEFKDLVNDYQPVVQLCKALAPLKVNYALLVGLENQGEKIVGLKPYIKDIKSMVKKLSDNFTYAEPEEFFEEADKLLGVMREIDGNKDQLNDLVSYIAKHSQNEHLYKGRGPNAENGKKYTIDMLPKAMHNIRRIQTA